MEQKTIDRLKIASRAIIKLRDAFEELYDATADKTTRDILEDKGFAYPFDKDMGEMYSDVIDWCFLAGEELDITVTVAEITDKIEDCYLSDTGKAQIVKALMKQYEKEIAAFDADMSFIEEA